MYHFAHSRRTTENTIDKINQINLSIEQLKMNPNLSKFGFLNSLDLPIQATKQVAVLNIRVLRTFLNFKTIKYKKYTFFLGKCTQKSGIFQNSSTSRTRILIGRNIGPTYLIYFNSFYDRYSCVIHPANTTTLGLVYFI